MGITLLAQLFVIFHFRCCLVLISGAFAFRPDCRCQKPQRFLQTTHEMVLNHPMNKWGREKNAPKRLPKLKANSHTHIRAQILPHVWSFVKVFQSTGKEKHKISNFQGIFDFSQIGILSNSVSHCEITHLFQNLAVSKEWHQSFWEGTEGRFCLRKVYSR
jgi:hypothetical protein